MNALSVSSRYSAGKRFCFWTVVLILVPGLFLSARSAYPENVTLIWGTYLGGSSSEDVSRAIAVDSSGSVYVAGLTYSSGFPVTSGAFDPSFNGNIDVFVAKLNPSGTALVYSTFLGGSGDETHAADAAVDSCGCLFVVGTTRSADFPTTSGAYDTSINVSPDSPWDLFVTKLNASGSALLYSTYLGGGTGYGEVARSLGIDSSGCAYVIGTTGEPNFPVTSGAFDCNYDDMLDGFITKFNADGSALVYSTFLAGGTKWDYLDAGAVDSSGCVYVTGCTMNGYWPTTTGAFDRTRNAPIDPDPEMSRYGYYVADAFVTKLNASGSALAYSTWLGGSAENRGKGIAVDEAGRAYVCGTTVSNDFPVTSGSFDVTNDGVNGFITRLNPAGSGLEYSGFMRWTWDIAVDLSGCAYAAGVSLGSIATTAGAFDTTRESNCRYHFLVKVNDAGTALDYVTYAGKASNDGFVHCGVSVDGDGDVYLVGCCKSRDFPTTAGAFDETFNDTGGGDDVVVAKLTTDIAVSGTATFKYPGWSLESPVRIQYRLRDPGLPPGPPLHSGTMTVCLAPGNPAVGNYGIVATIADGTYDLALKHANHIADMKTVVISDGVATGIDFTLWAGDADGDNNFNTVYPTDQAGDNDVDLKDYYTLYYQYQGTKPVTAGYNADFNADGTINVLDYNGLKYGYVNRKNPGNWY